MHGAYKHQTSANDPKRTLTMNKLKLFLISCMVILIPINCLAKETTQFESKEEVIDSLLEATGSSGTNKRLYSTIQNKAIGVIDKIVREMESLSPESRLLIRESIFGKVDELSYEVADKYSEEGIEAYNNAAAFQREKLYDNFTLDELNELNIIFNSKTFYKYYDVMQEARQKTGEALRNIDNVIKPYVCEKVIKLFAENEVPEDEYNKLLKPNYVCSSV
jgi:hypothetical protein